MKNRKSSIFFLPIIVIFTLGVLVYLYIVLLGKGSFEEPIGKRQFDLLKTYVKAESALFYIDQSSKYALQQAVYELAQNGVSVSEFDINELNLQVFERNKCGKFKDAYVWYELKKDASNNYVKGECFDKDPLNINLLYFFNKNLNKYLTSSQYNIPINNYNYEIKDNLEMIGKAILPLKFDILKDESKPAAKKPVETKIEQKKSEDFTQSTEENLCAKGVRCVLAEDAYNLLLEAQKIALKKGKKLIVNSAYRSQEEQIAVWNRFASTYPDARERRKKVCDPFSQVCPHTTGNAVDVVFDGKTTGTMSSYDWLTLHEIMTSVKNENGESLWVRYGGEKKFDIGEPWHFECCGTDRYARAKAQGVTAIV